MVRSTPFSQPRPILNIIAEFAPRAIKRNPSPRWQFQMECPFPYHGDGPTDGGSFYVDETQQLYRCFGCDAGGNAFQIQQQLTSLGNRPQAADRTRKMAGTTRRQDKKLRKLQGVTIPQLARAKSLDADHLKILGWQDTHYSGTPAIMIPYFDLNGSDPLVGYRVALVQGNRFKWQRFAPGQHLRPYGLWLLPWIRQQGYCFLVEGETDYAALSQRGVAELGIPGAGNYRSECTPWLRDLDLCAWQEPGESGEKFVQRLRSEFDSLDVIDAPDFAKDPCSLLGMSWQ
jgi:hypothetical protein